MTRLLTTADEGTGAYADRAEFVRIAKLASDIPELYATPTEDADSSDQPPPDSSEEPPQEDPQPQR